MIVTGHMNFFEINECGLYKHGDPQIYGCGVDETFELITEWVKGKTLRATLPWDSVDARSGSAKCYCKDFYKDDDTGDFVLVLWKSDDSAAGTLWGAQEADATGTGALVEYTNNYKGAKVVWGRPCYYWIIPRLNTIVSIKFDHSICDSQLMQDWVAACINNRVHHPNKSRETTPAGHIRLSFTDNPKDIQFRYRYGFDVALKTLSTSASQLSDLAARVTHIVRRETINIETKDDRAEWLKKLGDMLYLQAKPRSKQRQIEVIAEAKPTASEIKVIIEKYAQQNRKRSDWENVGFTTDDGSVTWVDKYRLKNSININHDHGIISAGALYARLAKDREELIRPLLKAVKPQRNRAAKN